jgi:hypothetical protein
MIILIVGRVGGWLSGILFALENMPKILLLHHSPFLLFGRLGAASDKTIATKISTKPHTSGGVRASL